MTTLLPQRSSASDVAQPAGIGAPSRQATQKQPAALGTLVLTGGAGAGVSVEEASRGDLHGSAQRCESGNSPDVWRRISEGALPANGKANPAAHLTDQGTATSRSSSDQCVLCYERPCELEMKPCRHSCCSKCMLAILCHCKPNRGVPQPSPPACPFCRAILSTIECIV